MFLTRKNYLSPGFSNILRLQCHCVVYGCTVWKVSNVTIEGAWLILFFKDKDLFLKKKIYVFLGKKDLFILNNEYETSL